MKTFTIIFVLLFFYSCSFEPKTEVDVFEEQGLSPEQLQCIEKKEAEFQYPDKKSYNELFAKEACKIVKPDYCDSLIQKAKEKKLKREHYRIWKTVFFHQCEVEIPLIFRIKKMMEDESKDF